MPAATAAQCRHCSKRPEGGLATINLGLRLLFAPARKLSEAGNVVVGCAWLFVVAGRGVLAFKRMLVLLLVVVVVVFVDVVVVTDVTFFSPSVQLPLT